MNMAGDPYQGTAAGKAVDLLDRGDHAFGAAADDQQWGRSGPDP
jgi:hypothetical protein